MTNWFIFILCSAFSLTAQGQQPVTSFPSGVPVSNRSGVIEQSTELIFEGQKIAPLASHAANDLNIIICKARDRSGNVVQKDVVIGDIVGLNTYNGFIDMSEINDAINSLEYIRDSLLPQKPTNQFTYIKNFTKSNFRIIALFDPAAGRFAQWYINLVRDTNFPNSTLTVNKSDLPNMITALKTAREKLKDF